MIELRFEIPYERTVPVVKTLFSISMLLILSSVVIPVTFFCANMVSENITAIKQRCFPGSAFSHN